MAFLKGELSGSHNLARASQRAVRRFFTKRFQPPSGWNGPKPVVDRSLARKYSNAVETCLYSLTMSMTSSNNVNDKFKAVCQRFVGSAKEFVGSDAAPDELKAMRINKQVQFKNIRVRVRDGAHAAGRFLASD